MGRKSISIISYFTILGWLISFVVYSHGGKSSFAQFHLKQSFGLGILETLLGIEFFVIYPIFPAVSRLFIPLSLVIAVVLISGINNALNHKRKPLPLFGRLFVDRFYFIAY
jgi:uncharacterized membrane protein